MGRWGDGEFYLFAAAFVRSNAPRLPVSLPACLLVFFLGVSACDRRDNQHIGVAARVKLTHQLSGR